MLKNYVTSSDTEMNVLLVRLMTLYQVHRLYAAKGVTIPDGLGRLWIIVFIAHEFLEFAWSV
jgi:hypothetical protein